MNNLSLPVNRIYKDRLYKMIFNDKSELLKLYNAINGTHYDDPAMLTITTLDNAIYMTMENDLSFIIDMRLALYEQQSTVHNRYLFSLYERHEHIWFQESADSAAFLRNLL